jgi:hypothetical protein
MLLHRRTSIGAAHEALATVVRFRKLLGLAKTVVICEKCLCFTKSDRAFDKKGGGVVSANDPDGADDGNRTRAISLGS